MQLPLAHYSNHSYKNAYVHAQKHSCTDLLSTPGCPPLEVWSVRLQLNLKVKGGCENASSVYSVLRLYSSCSLCDLDTATSCEWVHCLETSLSPTTEIYLTHLRHKLQSVRRVITKCFCRNDFIYLC